MDAGLPDNRLGGILTGFGELVARVFPGDPYSQPWVDLMRLAQPVATERFQFGTYFICTIAKPGVQPSRHEAGQNDGHGALR